MRIIAGSAKGKRLKVASEGTRPSTDRTRESLFSILQFILRDAVVLDLFAGSGALGLEAISRGAKRASFVENDRISSRIIKENIKLCNFTECAVYEESVENFLAHLSHSFTLCFADPPYENSFKGSQLEAVLNSKNLHNKIDPAGFLITESPQSLRDLEFDFWAVTKSKRFGKSHLTIFQKK